ncbi:MAG TPA: hypothetical protein VF777_06975 [Phycisphaerales bacterium]
MRNAVSIAAVSVPVLLAATMVMLWLASPEFDVEFLIVLLGSCFGCLAIGPLFTFCRSLRPSRGVVWTSLTAFLLTSVLGFSLGASDWALNRNLLAARSDLERVRDQVLSDASPTFPIKLGRFHVRYARKAGGAVFFVLRRNPDTETGVVWSQSDPPPVLGPRIRHATSRRLTENWYTFMQSND